jgi:hypothetical protein
MCFCLAAICCYLAATPIFLVLVISVVTVCCMPTHKVSKDLKAQIPALFHQEGLNIKEICVLLGLK